MVSEDASDAVELTLTARLTGGTRSTDLKVPLELATATGADRAVDDYTIEINDAGNTDDNNITIEAGDATGTAKVTVTITEQGNDKVYSGNTMVNIIVNNESAYAYR